MSYVDERIVQMEFDNQQFEENAQQSINTLDKLKQSLNLEKSAQSFSELDRAARSVDLGPLSGAVEAVTSHFSALEIMGITALTNITNSAISAGKRIFSALYIDPVKTGLSEYELKMDSIQVIQSNTQGKNSMDEIKASLEDLNTYADKTIYNFAQMTDNIGKFTAAGVGLEDSVTAIKGLSNLSALQGANAAQNARAMYNLSQALSVGKMQLMDWRSFENAGLGGKTFRDELVKTAQELGYFEKNWTAATGKAISGQDLLARANDTFRESLSYGWVDNDVMIKTLAKFGDQTTELGERAFKAAQDVRTFSKMVDALKEAAQSGWAQTWELIIGDMDEATKLWTAVNNVISDFLSRSSDARNEMLKQWRAEGGREKMLEALANTFKAFTKLVAPIKAAFKGVFEGLDAKKLVDITERFLAFSKSLTISIDTAANIRKTFSGLFSVVGIGIDFLKAFVRVISQIIKPAGRLVGTLLDISGGFGSYINNLRKSLKANDTFFKGMTAVYNFISGFFKKLIGLFEQITGIDVHIPKFEELANAFTLLKEKLGPVASAFGEAKEKVSEFFATLNLPKIDTSKFGNVFEKIGAALTYVWNVIKTVGGRIISGAKEIISQLDISFSDFNLGNLLTIVESGALTSVLLNISSFFKELKGTTSESKGIIDSVKEVFTTFKEDGLKGLLGFGKDTSAIDSLGQIAKAIGILAASLVAISFVKPEKLRMAFAALISAMGSLFGAISIFEKTSGQGSFDALNKAAMAMIKISVALLIMSASINKLAKVDPDNLANALLSVLSLLAMVGVLIKALDGTDTDLSKTAGGMIGIAIAIRIMASAVGALAKIDPDRILQGLLSVLILLTGLGIFLTATDFEKMGVRVGVGLIAVAAALRILVGAVQKLGDLKAEVLKKGLISIGVILAEIGAFTLLAGNSKHILATSIALVIISAALHILAGALNKFGSIDTDVITKGLGAMAIMLLELAVAALLMGQTNMIAVGAGMLIMGASMHVMAGALERLGNLSLEQIIKSLGALAATFLILGLAGKFVAPMAIGILGLSAALLIFSLSIVGIGVGINLIAIGITALATALSAGTVVIVESLILIIDSIASMIPLVAQKLGEGVVQCALAIGAGASAIGLAIFMIMGTLLSIIESYIPRLIEVGLKLITSLLMGIAENIALIVAAGVLIIANFIYGLAQALPTLIDAAMNLMVAFVNGLADGIRENGPALIDAFFNLLGALLELGIDFVQTILEGIPVIGGALGDAVGGLKDLIKGAVSKDSMSESGAEGMAAFANGITGSTDSVMSSASSVGDAAKQGLEKAKEGASGIGDGLAKDYLGGIELNYEQAGISAEGLGTKALDGLGGVGDLAKEIGAGQGSDYTNSFFDAITNGASGSGDSAQALVDGLSGVLEGAPAEAESYGTDYANDYNNAISSKKGDSEKAALELSGSAVNGLGQNSAEFEKQGQAGGNKYIGGINSKKEDAKAAGFGLKNSAVSGTSGSYDDMYDAGENAGRGFYDGLGSMMSSIESRAREMANTAYETAQRTLDEHSPSKKFMKLGAWAGEGFVIGLGSFKERVKSTTESLASSSLNAMSNVVSRIGDALSSDLDASPTIRPVLDLSNIEDGADYINGALSGMNGYIPVTALRATNRVASNMSGSNAPGDISNLSSGSTYNFTQNNYSPKALSRLEIYRQSRNLFAAMKGQANA